MAKIKKGQTLTDKQKLFVIEYVKDWNGQRAAIAAGYSKKTAAVIASENLNKPNIQEFLHDFMEKNSMESKEVLYRLTSQARGTHAPFIKLDSEGFIYFDFSNPEALQNLHLIKKIKTKRNRRINQGTGQEWEGEWVEVELHDQQKALELIGRAHGLFKDNLDLTSQGENLNKQITESEYARSISALAQSLGDKILKKNR